MNRWLVCGINRRRRNATYEKKRIENRIARVLALSMSRTQCGAYNTHSHRCFCFVFLFDDFFFHIWALFETRITLTVPFSVCASVWCVRVYEDYMQWEEAEKRRIQTNSKKKRTNKILEKRTKNTPVKNRIITKHNCNEINGWIEWTK